MKKFKKNCTTDQEHARKIMRKNFFGIEEAIKHFKIKSTDQQLSVLAEIPFSETVLQECKDSHILMAVFPISILDIRDKVDQNLFHSYNPWYDNQVFAKERSEVGWQLIRKEAVTDSMSKKWQEQQLLLTKDEEVPTAQVVVYTIIGYYFVTGERLFEKIYVRTSSVNSGGICVNVGVFVLIGLDIYCSWDGYCRYNLGVASARKRILKS